MLLRRPTFGAPGGLDRAAQRVACAHWRRYGTLAERPGAIRRRFGCCRRTLRPRRARESGDDKQGAQRRAEE